MLLVPWVKKKMWGNSFLNFIAASFFSQKWILEQQDVPLLVYKVLPSPDLLQVARSHGKNKLCPKTPPQLNSWPSETVSVDENYWTWLSFNASGGIRQLNEWVTFPPTRVIIWLPIKRYSHILKETSNLTTTEEMHRCLT